MGKSSGHGRPSHPAGRLPADRRCQRPTHQQRRHLEQFAQRQGRRSTGAHRGAVGAAECLQTGTQGHTNSTGGLLRAYIGCCMCRCGPRCFQLWAQQPFSSLDDSACLRPTQVRQRPRLATGAALQWQQLVALTRKNFIIRRDSQDGMLWLWVGLAWAQGDACRPAGVLPRPTARRRSSSLLLPLGPDMETLKRDCVVPALAGGVPGGPTCCSSPRPCSSSSSSGRLTRQASPVPVLQSLYCMAPCREALLPRSAPRGAEGEASRRHAPCCCRTSSAPGLAFRAPSPPRRPAVSASRQSRPAFSRVEVATAAAAGPVPDCSANLFMRAGQPCYTFLYAPTVRRHSDSPPACIWRQCQSRVPSPLAPILTPALHTECSGAGWPCSTAPFHPSTLPHKPTLLLG